MIRKLDEILEKLKNGEKEVLVVASAQDKEVLLAIKEAYDKGIIQPILIGDSKKIKYIAKDIELKLDDIKIIHSDNIENDAEIAVKLVSNNEADYVMKGLLDTSVLLKAVLNKEYGLRTDSLLSHVMVYQLDNYDKLLLLTDGGMNIYPDYNQKEMILKNAVRAFESLGIENVKVACLAAKEKVNPKMQATVDADKLYETCKNGKFGQNVIVEGPLAFDLAINKEACEIKGYKGMIQGDADILLVPTIEMGNGIGKAFTYMANAKSAGVIMGAKVPIVLVSRADSHESKLYSIAYGALISKL